MVETGWLCSFARPAVFIEDAICAAVFCFFLAEVEEEFVVGEECGLRGFDLDGGRS